MTKPSNDEKGLDLLQMIQMGRLGNRVGDELIRFRSAAGAICV